MQPKKDAGAGGSGGLLYLQLRKLISIVVSQYIFTYNLG